MKTAVFAGTFDPITNGHVFIVKKCLEQFDKILIVVADNDKKIPLFSSEERKDFIERVFKGFSNVEVYAHHGLMMDFMKERGLVHYIRGVRNDGDLEYEKRMEDFNKSIYPSLVNVYIDALDELKSVSSTKVRTAKNEDELKSLIPNEIFTDVKKRLKK